MADPALPRAPGLAEQAQSEEAAQMMPGMGGMQLPEFVTHIEGPQTNTKRKQIAPEAEAQIREEQIANQERDASARAVRAAGADKNSLAEQEAGESAANMQATLERQQEARAEQDKLVAAAQAESAARRAQLEKDAKITTYWEDKGKPAELFSIFMTGLSEMSNVKAGGKYGESPLAKQYEAAIAKDERDKIRKFETSKYFLELSEKDVELAKKAKADKLAEIKDESIVQGEVLAKRFKSYAAKVGTQEALAKADEADAVVRASQAKSLEEQQKEKNIEIDTQGRKVTTTENKNKNQDKGPMRATSKDLEDRDALVNRAKDNREYSRILLNNEGAYQQLQGAVKQFGINFADGGGVTGKLMEQLRRGANLTATPDEALKNADPDARRAFALFKSRLSALAKARGAAITESDVQQEMEGMGLLGNNSREAADMAEMDAQRADKRRISLEKNKKFADPTEEEHVGNWPSVDEDQRRHENHKAREEKKAKALAKLVKVSDPSKGKTQAASTLDVLTRLPGARNKELREAVDAARDAGISEDMIEKFAPGWSEKKKEDDE